MLPPPPDDGSRTDVVALAEASPALEQGRVKLWQEDGRWFLCNRVSLEVVEIRRPDAAAISKCELSFCEEGFAVVIVDSSAPDTDELYLPAIEQFKQQVFITLTAVSSLTLTLTIREQRFCQ